jgi:hypothetical protein
MYELIEGGYFDRVDYHILLDLSECDLSDNKIQLTKTDLVKMLKLLEE